LTRFTSSVKGHVPKMGTAQFKHQHSAHFRHAAGQSSSDVNTMFICSVPYYRSVTNRHRKITYEL